MKGGTCVVAGFVRLKSDFPPYTGDRPPEQRNHVKA